MLTRAFSLAAFLTALAGLPACFNPCSDEQNAGKYNCDGNHVVGCYMDDTGLISTDADCGNLFCRNPEPGVAFCAARANPDPSCPNNIDAVCNASGEVVDCERGGYVTKVLTTCGTPEFCISGHVDGPFCALANQPDPRCPPASTPIVTLLCGDGGHLLGCKSGYLVDDKDCGDSGLCYTPTAPWEGAFQNPICVLAAAVDPACMRIPSPIFGDPRHKTGCDGTQMISCIDNLRVEAHDCGAKGCAAKNDVATCNP